MSRNLVPTTIVTRIGHHFEKEKSEKKEMVREEEERERLVRKKYPNPAAVPNVHIQRVA